MLIVIVRILTLKIGHSFEVNPCSSKQELKIPVPHHFQLLLISSDSSFKDPNRSYYNIDYISCTRNRLKNSEQPLFASGATDKHFSTRDTMHHRHLLRVHQCFQRCYQCVYLNTASGFTAASSARCTLYVGHVHPQHYFFYFVFQVPSCSKLSN